MVRKRLLFRMIILVIFALSTVGCSQITKIYILQAEIADTGWASSAKNRRSYKFQQEGVTVVICPVLKLEWFYHDLISMGPPLFPIIPVFALGQAKRDILIYVRNEEKFFGRKVNLEVQIGIASPTNLCTIDFSKVRAEFPKGKSLPPSKISGFEEIIECPSPSEPTILKSPIPAESIREREQIQIGEVAIINKRMYFLLEFDIRLVEVEEFILDLGCLSVNEKNIKLPPLKYKERSQYKYLKLGIPAIIYH